MYEFSNFLLGNLLRRQYLQLKRLFANYSGEEIAKWNLFRTIFDLGELVLQLESDLGDETLLKEENKFNKTLNFEISERKFPLRSLKKNK